MTPAQYGKFLLQRAKADGTLREASNGIRYSVRAADKPRGEYSAVLTAWSGKSTAPRYRALVKPCDIAARVSELVSNAQARFDAKAADRVRHKLEEASMRAQLQVGTLLCNSWGYEQTNVDYYQVVARSKTGATVTVRRIASRTVRDVGYMSRIVAPDPGVFIGPATKKRVGRHGVQFAHGWTKPVSADHTCNSTSYH